MKNRILIIDDDPTVLEMMEAALKDENFDVKTLSNSRNAVAEVMAFKPDVLLLDYLMGDINGGEICHQIKSSTFTSHIKVIIISAYPRVFESLGSYGCDFFIPKPFDLCNFIDTIKDCCKRYDGLIAGKDEFRITTPGWLFASCNP